MFNSPSRHSAHAALSPWEGKNALDAAVLGYNNISSLRQQLKPTHRVHAIIEGTGWEAYSQLLISRLKITLT
jgi:metal-dependent amidase/aminoacylase/carboxypeptidase family protein